MSRYFSNLTQLIKLISLIIWYRLYKWPQKLNINDINNIQANQLGKTDGSKYNYIYGIRLAKMLKQLGPVYIKFGQALSTRPDLISADVADGLKCLQDKLPAFDSNVAKAIIERSLGKKINELFAEFNDQPVAAASISQVHKAVTIDGVVVAVKILRPNIYKIYKQDIEFLYFIVSIINFCYVKIKRLRLKEIVRVLADSMKIELDLRLEAAASSELSDNFKGSTDLYVPKVFWSLTSNYVLTTEWITGISIYDKDLLAANNIDLKTIAAKLATIFFNQVFEYGYFHADLHPGNILILQNGQIALIDFGIMGRLSYCDRQAIAEMLYGFLKRDYYKIAKIHVQIGYVPKDTDIALFAQACRSIGEPIIGLPVGQISVSNLLGQLFKIVEDFSLEIQPQLILLQKTLIVLEGIGQNLDPSINMWLLADQWIKRWAIHNLTPEAKLMHYVKHKFNNLIDEIFNSKI